MFGGNYGSCGCNNMTMYQYYGNNNNYAIILVLFILLVIIFGVGFINNGNNHEHGTHNCCNS